MEYERLQSVARLVGSQPDWPECPPGQRAPWYAGWVSGALATGGARNDGEDESDADIEH